MKKLTLFFAALMVAFAANATTYVNAPGSWNSWKDNGVEADASGVATVVISNATTGAKFKIKVWDGSDHWYGNGGTINLNTEYVVNSNTGEMTLGTISGSKIYITYNTTNNKLVVSETDPSGSGEGGSGSEGEGEGEGGGSSLKFFGNLNSAGWKTADLTANAYTFTVTTTSYFTFKTSADWSGAWRPEGNADVTITADGNFTASGSSDGVYVIEKAGEYTVTVSNEATKTFSITGFAAGGEEGGGEEGGGEEGGETPAFKVSYGIESSETPWTVLAFTKLGEGTAWETDTLNLPTENFEDYKLWVGNPNFDDAKSATVAITTIGGAAAGARGVFRIYDDSDAKNWYVHFIKASSGEEEGGGEGGGECGDGPYGIKVNGTTIHEATAAGTDYDGRSQYLVNVQLEKDDEFVFINTSCGATWVEAIEEGGESANFTKGESSITCNVAGCYAIYLKLKYEDNIVYIGKGDCGGEGGETPEYTVAIAGAFNDWSTTANTTTSIVDNCATITVSNWSNTKEEQTDGFKVVVNGKWYSTGAAVAKDSWNDYVGNEDANMTLPAEANGKYATFTVAINNVTAEGGTINFKVTWSETTGLNTVEDSAIYAHEGRIYAAESFCIYDLLGRDVTRQNGNLNGIYVVKTATAAQKIVVK